jgi:hypothetical protein
MTLAPRTSLSSPGKSAMRVFTLATGRPSTPRPIGSTAGFPAYWIPAFAGMTSCAWGNEKETQTQW